MDFGAPVGMEKLFLKQIIHSGERLPSEQKHGKERERVRERMKKRKEHAVILMLLLHANRMRS